MLVLAAETDFPTKILLAIPLFLLVCVLLALLGRLNQRRRDRALERFAHAHGLRYARRDDAWTRTELADRLDAGRDHRARNVITGEYRGRRIAWFLHTYVTGSGDTSSTTYAVVTAIGLPRRFPALRVAEHRGRIHAIGRIELESADFNRRFVVHGHPRLAYDVLHPRLMQWLLDRRAPGFVIGDHYLAHLRYGLQETDRLDADLAYLDAILAQIPGFVLAPGGPR